MRPPSSRHGGVYSCHDLRSFSTSFVQCISAQYFTISSPLPCSTILQCITRLVPASTHLQSDEQLSTCVMSFFNAAALPSTAPLTLTLPPPINTADHPRSVAQRAATPQVRVWYIHKTGHEWSATPQRIYSGCLCAHSDAVGAYVHKGACTFTNIPM